MYAIYIATGTLMLYFGAEWLVNGSSRLALKMGVSSLVVGLTVVAFETSAPELVVSVFAGLRGSGGIAVGNVVGSNIFNIAVILGISSMIRSMKVNIRILKTDAPLLVVLSFLLWLFLKNGILVRAESALLFSGIIIYTFFTVYSGKKSGVDMPGIEDTVKFSASRGFMLNIIFVVAGIMFLVAGSKLFVKGAVEIAGILGISETVIGLTVVSAGTSLPELATSVLASIKGEEDIAVGNIIGSNIFNILAILGTAGLISPLSFSDIGIIDMAVFAGTAVLILPIMRTGFRISRIEGAFFLVLYGFYLKYLIG